MAVVSRRRLFLIVAAVWFLASATNQLRRHVSHVVDAVHEQQRARLVVVDRVVAVGCPSRNDPHGWLGAAACTHPGRWTWSLGLPVSVVPSVVAQC